MATGHLLRKYPMNPRNSNLPIQATASVNHRMHRGSCFSERLGSLPTVACLLAVAAVSAGCSTAPGPDPLEAANRKVFAFNEGVDKVVLKPAAKAYQAVVPTVAQTGITNFFSNLQQPWTSVNLLVQGEPKASLGALARFGTNTTVGVLGLMDPASGWGMRGRSEDFGLTLDTWGVGSGSYLVLPLFGASNLRDALASPVDSVGSASSHIASASARNTLTVTHLLSKRSQHLGAGELVDQMALDKYAMVRDMHLKRRNRGRGAEELRPQQPLQDQP